MTEDPHRRWHGVVLVVALFVGEMLLYFSWRIYVCDDLFGGDTVNISLYEWNSYALHKEQVRSFRKFSSQLRQGRTGDPEKDLAAFLYAKLSPAGKDIVGRLADQEASDRDKQLLILELHRSVLDEKVTWPEAVLAATEMPPRVEGSGEDRHYDRRVLELGFDTISPRPWYRGTFHQALDDTARVITHAFAQIQPTRYSPLTNIYVHLAGILLHKSSNVPVVACFIAIAYALLMVLVFLLARTAIRSLAWSLAALFLFQFCTSAITMSYLLFALPYVFVPIVMAGAVLCYVRYKQTGRLAWLGGFVAFAVVGPWFREFPGAIPFVVAVCEVLTFRRWRSAVILGICLPLMVHCVYPSLLPRLLGFNSGKVYGVYEQTNAIMQSRTSRLHWAMFANMALQFPPVFWILTLVSVGYWIYQSCRSPWPETAVRPWIRKVIRLGTLNSPRVRRSVPIVCAVAFLAIVCICALYMNHRGWRAVPNKVGRLTMLLWLVFVVLSLRFGVALPIYMAMIFPVFLKVQLAEVHLTFIMFPLAILVVLWIRDLVVSLRARPAGARRMAALLAVGLLGCIGLADHGLNLHACASTQKELVRANRHMGEWIRDNTPRHGIVLCNFYNLTDVFYYSGYYFNPYEIKANCPMGSKKVVDTVQKLQELYDRNSGIRDIYFLAAEQDFRPTHADWDAHQFVRKPPGPLTKLAVFSARNHYWYADPLRWFTPRRLVSFPGYMDWADDFYVNNLPAPFRRLTYADYTLYRLESLHHTDSSQ